MTLRYNANLVSEGAIKDSEGNKITTTYAKSADLATVATSGDYDDLTNKPSIPAAQVQADWNETDTTSMAYIQNKPNIPSGVIVDQTYDGTSTNAQSGVAIEGELANYVENSDLATVATTGAYSDLSGTPTLATVATSGNYNDLTNKPTIPDISGKQDTLVSGTNIKTVNNTSLLGSGNIDTSQIFFAVYGTTTANQITQALGSGKTIFCIKSTSIDYTYYYSGIVDSAYTFSRVYQNTTEVVYVSFSTNVWNTITATLEQTTNKVTSLSSSSTDTQYPSAKCVYDLTENNRFDGQWVIKYLLVSNATAIGSRTHDLSSYLPNDGYTYEVLFRARISTVNGSSGGSCRFAFGTVASPYDNLNTAGFLGLAYVTTNSTQSCVNATIPIDNNRVIYTQMQNHATESTNFVAMGYRRIGTNS